MPPNTTTSPPSGAAIERGLRMTGTAVVADVPTTYTLLMAADGRFRLEVAGRFGGTSGFDGQTAWRADGSGAVQRLVMEERDVLLLSTWALTGRLFEPDAPVRLTPAGMEKGDSLYDVRFEGAREVAKLTLAEPSRRPVQLARESWRGEQRWTYSDHAKLAGHYIPRRVVHTIAGQTQEELRLVEAGFEAGIDRRLFVKPDAGPADTRFDPHVSARVQAMRTVTGHILVRPEVDGQDLGWFVLDSGAGVSILTPAAAASARMPALGRTVAGGAGPASVTGSFRQGRDFRLGPATIEGMLFLEMDLTMLAEAFGVPIAGVVGYDLFMRSIVRVDMLEPRVEVHDPAGFQLESITGRPGPGRWEELILYQNHPHVRGRFEGNRDGIFRIDTGGGQAAVLFHAPAVVALGLLTGRDVRSVRIGGAGGQVEGKMAPIAWFEIGGKRFEPLEVILALPGSGALDDPCTEGTLGGAVLGAFTLVFDYARERIAMIPR